MTALAAERWRTSCRNLDLRPSRPATSGNGNAAADDPAPGMVRRLAEAAERRVRDPTAPRPNAEASEDAPWQDLMAEPIDTTEAPAPAVPTDDVSGDDRSDATTIPLVDESTMYDTDTPTPSGITLDASEGTPEALAASADDLAQFARAVEIPTFGENVDSVAATADLVDEAVASYEEQHADADSESGRNRRCRPWPRRWWKVSGSPSGTWRRSSRSTTGPARASPAS